MLKGTRYIVHASRSKDDESANREGFDCGFLVPGSLNPHVRDERHGRYWSGLVVASGPTYILYISAHFIHKNRDDKCPGVDFVDELREETVQYWQRCKEKYGEDLGVLAGFDANVTLPSGVENVTGTETLLPLASHTSMMQQRVLAWMQTLGIKALNTFGEGLARPEMWTCGLNRKDAARSQIDYIGTSLHVDGTARPVNHMDLRSEMALTTKMDHRPIWAELTWTELKSGHNTSCSPAKVMPKRAFKDSSIRESFQRWAVQEDTMCLKFEAYEEELFKIGLAFYDQDRGDANVDAEQLCRKRLRACRLQARLEDDDLRRHMLTKAMWACIKQIKRSNSLQRLGKLQKTWQQEQRTLTRLRINGEYSYDREEWVQGALEFGRRRFGDAGNPLDRQHQRLDEMSRVVQNETLDGVARPKICYPH